MTFGRTAAALLIGTLLPASLSAQGWTVDAAAGRALHDPVSARVQSTVASLGLGWEGGGGARWLYLSAGTPLGDPGPAWGAAGAGGWVGVERGAFTVGASLGAHLFGYGASGDVGEGGGATLEILPTVAFTRGPVRAELSSGFVGTADLVGDSTASRAVHESGARLAFTGAPGVEVAAEGRFLRTDEGDWPYAGGRASIDRGKLQLWAHAGQWLNDSFPSPKTAYGVGAGYEVLPRTRLQADWRQEPVDPVYFGTPRRTWTVQIRRSLGRAPARAPAASTIPAPRAEGGWVLFRLPRGAHPAAPELVGSFTGWKPVAMAEEGDWWTVRLQVAPGAHHYAYRGTDGASFVPAGLPAVDDGMGGTSAVLVVP